MSSLSFINQFVRCFVPAPFIQLARTAQWLRRQGKIDAFEFLTSLVFGQLSALRLTLNAQAQGLAQPVTRQAIDQRYTPAAVVYLQSAFPLPEPNLARATFPPDGSGVAPSFCGGLPGR